MAWGGSSNGQFHGAWFGEVGESTVVPAIRSMMAPWIGGASIGPASTTQVGYRGLMSFWAGGASPGAASATQAGYRGFLGFWAGGGGPGPASDAVVTEWIVLARRRGRR